jgi:hypothetical protein
MGERGDPQDQTHMAASVAMNRGRDLPGEDLQWRTTADTRAQRRSDPRRRASGGWVPPVGAEARW